VRKITTKLITGTLQRSGYMSPFTGHACCCQTGLRVFMHARVRGVSTRVRVCKLIVSQIRTNEYERV
jgi:hypothetical protein